MSDLKDAMDYQNWTITQLKNQRDELRDLCVFFYNQLKEHATTPEDNELVAKATEVLERIQ